MQSACILRQELATKNEKKLTVFTLKRHVMQVRKGLLTCDRQVKLSSFAGKLSAFAGKFTRASFTAWRRGTKRTDELLTSKFARNI